MREKETNYSIAPRGRYNNSMYRLENNRIHIIRTIAQWATQFDRVHQNQSTATLISIGSGWREWRLVRHIGRVCACELQCKTTTQHKHIQRTRNYSVRASSKRCCDPNDQLLTLEAVSAMWRLPVTTNRVVRFERTNTRGTESNCQHTKQQGTAHSTEHQAVQVQGQWVSSHMNGEREKKK